MVMQKQQSFYLFKKKPSHMFFVVTCTTIDADCATCERTVSVAYTGTAVTVTYGANPICLTCNNNGHVSADGSACIAATGAGKVTLDQLRIQKAVYIV